MHQQYDKQQLGQQGKGSSAGLIGSAIVGAAVGAAVMLASDPAKRKTVVEKAKETKDRVSRAVDEIKRKKDQVVDGAQMAMSKDDDTELL